MQGDHSVVGVGDAVGIPFIVGLESVDVFVVFVLEAEGYGLGVGVGEGVAEELLLAVAVYDLEN